MKTHCLKTAAVLVLGTAVSTAWAQPKGLKALRELANLGADKPQPAALTAPTPSPVPASSASNAGLALKFNVMLGEPPIADARDTRCEAVAPTNPADLVKNLLGDHKDRILQVLDLRRKDQRTDTAENDLMASVRRQMKEQVWLPLAIEEEIGRRILEQRTATIIAEDDPAAADFYPAAKEIFAELTRSATGAQPYDLRLVVIDDQSGIPNAETLPGGIILMNIALAQAERERVFAYLSHELGHVTKRHQTMALQAKLIDSAQGVNAVRELAGLGGQELLTKVLDVVDLTAAVFTRYYTAQELEADGCGGKYLAASPNNDGARSVEMFLQDVGEIEKLAGAAPKSDSDLVKESHPSYAERQRTLVDSYRYWSTPR